MFSAVLVHVLGSTAPQLPSRWRATVDAKELSCFIQGKTTDPISCPVNGTTLNQQLAYDYVTNRTLNQAFDEDLKKNSSTITAIENGNMLLYILDEFDWRLSISLPVSSFYDTL